MGTLTRKRCFRAPNVLSAEPLLGLTWDKLWLAQAPVPLASEAHPIHILDIEGAILRGLALTIPQS